MIRFPRTLISRLVPLRRVVSPLTLLVWAAACDHPEPADVVEIVGATTACTGCRIELGPPLELVSDKPGEAVLVLSPAAVTMDAEGRYWVAERGQVARVYDVRGKFVKTIGKKGGGPNEIDAPFAFLPLPGDSMLVFDYKPKDYQAFVVDSQFRTIRTLRFPALLMPASAEGWPANVLVSGPLPGDSSEGLALHTMSAKQSEVMIVRSFGPGKLPRALTTTAAVYQRVSSAKDGGYWSADILRYRISHFAADGTLIGTIEREPDWFALPSPDYMGTPAVPPPPRILGIWQAPDGLLWVFASVAGKNWKDAWPKLAPGVTDVNVSALQFDKLFSTMVEVLDPITRNVVSTAKLDDYVTDVLPNGNVAVFAKDSTKFPHLYIRRLSLTR